MTAIEICAEKRDMLKSCLALTHFIGRMRGDCNSLKTEYEVCMDIEFQNMKQRNLKEARRKEQRWKELRQSVGLN